MVILIEHCQMVLPLLGRNDSVGRQPNVQSIRPRALTVHTCPRRTHSPNGCSYLKRPTVLPLLGRNDSVAFRSIGSQTARSAGLASLRRGELPHQTVRLSRDRLTIPPLLGERAGVRGIAMFELR